MKAKKYGIMGVLFLAAIISTTATAQWEPLTLNQQPLQSNPVWDAALDRQGAFWFAYYGNDADLHIRRPDGTELKLGATGRTTVLSGLAMDARDSGIDVVWRDKLPQKTLYWLPDLKPEGAPPQSVVISGDGDSEALTRLKVAHEAKETFFLWYGEKGDPETRAKHHIYFRYSQDEGKTLSPVERVIAGIYPTWIIDQDKIPIFSWTYMDGSLAMAMRVFNRTDKTFGPVVKITDAPEIGPLFEAFKSGGRWFLMWVGRPDGTEPLVEGVYSDDQGQTWKRFAFDKLRGLEVASWDIAADGKGHLLMAMSGNWKYLEAGTKSDIFIMRSSDNGETWSELQRIRAPVDRETNGTFSSVTLDPQGTAVLAWQDWKGIRPNVYLSYSDNYGETWSDPAPVGRLGIDRLGLDYRADVSLRSANHRYYLVALRYNDDNLKKTETAVLYTFTKDELVQRVKDSRKALDLSGATEAHLRERVGQYWQAFVDGKYADSYPLLDPFFRSDPAFDVYKSRTTGAIKYHSFKIKEVNVRGNLAQVLLEIEASVPEFKLPNGKVYTQPQHAMDISDTWLFVDNNWYREYNDQTAGVRYTQY